MKREIKMSEFLAECQAETAISCLDVTFRDKRSAVESLFSDDGDTLKALSKAVVFLANLFRQAVAEFLEELSDVSMFLGPIGGLDAQ